MSRNINLDALRALRALPENSYGSRARHFLLVYGLARGLPMSRLESPRSNPNLFPDIKALVSATAPYFRPRKDDESDQDYQTAHAAFQEQIHSDLKEWIRSLHKTWLTVEAERRQRNMADEDGRTRRRAQHEVNRAANQLTAARVHLSQAEQRLAKGTP